MPFCSTFDVEPYENLRLSQQIFTNLYCSAAKSLYLMMDIILFFVALDCSVVIACDLLVFEITNTIDADTIVVFFDIFLTLFMAFSYFYLSEWITTDLLEIGDHFYDSPWYRLPVKQQRLLMLPILRTERVFRLKGLGIFDCSLAVFSAVYPFFASPPLNKRTK